MNKKGIVLSSVFFIFLIVLTLYTIFSQHSFLTIVDNFKMIKGGYISMCIGLVCLYFIFQGLYMKVMLKSLNEKITLRKGVFYSIVEFFYTNITPSSTGGQPAQLYYMSKDNIPMRKSMIVLILNTIMFKIFFIVFAIVIAILRPEYLTDSSLTIRILFFGGLLVDVFIITMGFLLMFHQGLVKKILDIAYKIKFKVIKKESKHKEKINQIMKNYLEESKYVKKHHKHILIGTLFTFIQRICLFSIPFVIYKSFGLSGHSYIDLLLIQIFATITLECLPLPGGTGASEHILNNLYVTMFGVLAPTGMILTRCLSFYIPLFVLLFVVIITSRIKYTKKQ